MMDVSIAPAGVSCTKNILLLIAPARNMSTLLARVAEVAKALKEAKVVKEVRGARVARVARTPRDPVLAVGHVEETTTRLIVENRVLQLNNSRLPPDHSRPPPKCTRLSLNHLRRV